MSGDRDDITDRLARLEGTEARTGDYLTQITTLVMKIDRERVEQRDRDARERAAALEREDRARQERLEFERQRDLEAREERRRQSWQQTAVIASSISVAILLGMLAIASGIALD